MKDDPTFSAYIRHLRWSLASLPADDRDDIIAETRSHLQERLERGVRIEEAIGDLGAPEDFARAFITERALLSALGSRDSMGLFAALGQRSVRNLRTISATAGCILAWALALVVCAVAAAKVFDPSHVGMWIGRGQFFLGVIDDPSRGSEVLGPWIFPVAFLVFFLARLVSRGLSVWALRPLASADHAALRGND
jgi:HAAS domain-containing protein